ncbi:tRNA uridine-5-carboxymethylaminomethyl(34) synthesis GTPase MnmE [Pseudoxanthobacter sp. M-2]|uniref:tRNA uridine-5-carboxymethylaminomethyl(34) synthesis GTPase MnmE n=1 Tax=Pseudoxanthobacter sp. M-2 TaxID=3078754 RepID=UPI0038FD3947
MIDRPEAQIDTIVALASGRPPAAIAVIRLSGSRAAETVRALCGRLPPPRRASLARFRDPRSSEVIDEGLALYLPGPGSPTGEDVAEFHVHGGRAVVAAMLDALTALPGVRLAESGEFTRRAFFAGRMDLAAVEGLADLVAADTDAQRRQALAQASGVLGARVALWRSQILEARALAEASLDFADEDDVAADALEQARAGAAALREEIAAALDKSRGGERLREGFRVVVLGPPNAGKSSLVNALARREVAIVTAEAGTTRDLIEVHLDLGGFPAIVTDTAGLREAAGLVEAEGIRRARARAEDADLVLWLSPADAPTPPPADLSEAPLQVVWTKADLSARSAPFSISTHTGAGLAELVAFISHRAAACLQGGEAAVLVRARHREAAEVALGALERALVPGVSPELVAEDLRLASEALGRIVGAVGVEDVLGQIFSAFCIGK